jgi:hypothetical protein
MTLDTSAKTAQLFSRRRGPNTKSSFFVMLQPDGVQLGFSGCLSCKMGLLPESQSHLHHNSPRLAQVRARIAVNAASGQEPTFVSVVQVAGERLNKDPAPPVHHKDWVTHLQNSTVGEWSVTSHCDDTEQHSILIFASADAGGTLCSTVGLMDVILGAVSGGELRTEILLDHRGRDSHAANVLATVAFYVLKNKWRPAPGVIFEDMLTSYVSDSPGPHVLLVPPYQWVDSRMSKVAVGEFTVYPLVAVPISESEREVVSTRGYEHLLTLWDERQTDVLDWTRVGRIDA